jgi:hypothetical protein
MDVTIQQALAIKAMFEYWNHLIDQEVNGNVGFYVDGEGGFRPNCEVTTNKELPELTDQIRKAAIVEEECRDRIYDFINIDIH